MSQQPRSEPLVNSEPSIRPYRVAGRVFTEQEVEIIEQIVRAGPGLSRLQLALQVCDSLEWRRASGRAKDRECADLFGLLERDGRIELPARRPQGRPKGASTRTLLTEAGEPGSLLDGSIEQFDPLALEPVSRSADRRLFRELINRYHYLGDRGPYGAQLRYLAFVSRPVRRLVGALQVSSPAWRLAVRDRWIGWDDVTRRRHLQQVVNNSRFLVLPWVRVRNLASRALSVLARRLPADWAGLYATTPLLIETLVDPARFRGTCYRAAGWLDLGLTAGRGRMDREHARHGHAPKRVLVLPLARDAASRLRGDA